MRIRPLLASACLALKATTPRADLDKRVQAVNEKVIAWRRDIHHNPELGMQATRSGTCSRTSHSDPFESLAKLHLSGGLTTRNYS